MMMSYSDKVCPLLLFTDTSDCSTPALKRIKSHLHSWKVWSSLSTHCLPTISLWPAQFCKMQDTKFIPGAFTPLSSYILTRWAVFFKQRLEEHCGRYVWGAWNCWRNSFTQ